MKVYAPVHNKSWVLLSAFSLLTTMLACGLVVQQPSTKPLSEADYKAACKSMPVSQLTQNADSQKGTLVKLTGQILVFEETTGANGKTTRLIIAVDDEAKTLPGGQLPVYIAYQGSINQFINDTVTIYGEVYGNDVYASPQIKEKTLPRVDAKYIEKAP